MRSLFDSKISVQQEYISVKPDYFLPTYQGENIYFEGADAVAELSRVFDMTTARQRDAEAINAYKYMPPAVWCENIDPSHLPLVAKISGNYVDDGERKDWDTDRMFSFEIREQAYIVPAGFSPRLNTYHVVRLELFEDKNSGGGVWYVQKEHYNERYCILSRESIANINISDVSQIKAFSCDVERFEEAKAINIVL